MGGSRDGEPENRRWNQIAGTEMRILILSINHEDQIVREVREREDKYRSVIREMISSRSVDLVCEESDPCRLSVAQKETFNHKPRIPWKNINMTSQERLEAGIWEALLHREYDVDFSNEEGPIQIDYRVPEDNVREEFFRDQILKAAKETNAKSVLVLCGDMHTESLKGKLEKAGQTNVQTDHKLTPTKYWRD